MSTDPQPETDDVDARLRELEVAKHDAIRRQHYRTAIRLAGESRRTARAGHRLEPYVWALHTMMNNAPALLDPAAGQDAAIELIAVLESEERARQIQPDLDPGEYDWLVSRVSSCAYDGMGRSVALARGCNSEGVHDTVAEGIQVCRRTGKLECINCFREYAADVLRAADDLEMALHHARQVVALGRASPDFDRRWAGAAAEADLLIAAGQLDAARAAVDRAADFVETYHEPTQAARKQALIREALDLLTGRDDGHDRPLDPADPSLDEHPQFHLDRDLNIALRAALRGDHAAAIATLAGWDRRLLEASCLDKWFEVRLRLVAAHRLAGDGDRADRLARPLAAKAREARDYLTLRRLARLADPAIPAAPSAPAQGFAPAGPVAARPDEPPRDESAAPPTPPITPLAGSLGELMATLAPRADDPAARAATLDAVLGFGPEAVTHPGDAVLLLGIAVGLGDDPARGAATWHWAEAIARPFDADAEVVSRLAALGDSLRQAEGSNVGDAIPARRVEDLVRRSLDLDPGHAGNFGRAAVFHARADRPGEAERCLARVLRLERGNARAACWLAEIYAGSDRAADALAVLDMALRAGADDPEVAWQAALQAHAQGQYEAVLTYLDRLARLAPDHPGATYYRASALIRLDRPADALAALGDEGPEERFELFVLRADALAHLGRLDDLRAVLTRGLAIRLGAITAISQAGLLGLAARLWSACEVLPADDRVVAAVVDRLIATGLAPDELFKHARESNPVADDLNYYACEVVQPLDADWPRSFGCLAGEADWTAYAVTWGVLAADEDDAARVALAWQGRTGLWGASIATVELRDEGYRDHPGVIFQGLRSAAGRSGGRQCCRTPPEADRSRSIVKMASSAGRAFRLEAFSRIDLAGKRGRG